MKKTLLITMLLGWCLQANAQKIDPDSIALAKAIRATLLDSIKKIEHVKDSIQLAESMNIQIGSFRMAREVVPIKRFSVKPKNKKKMLKSMVNSGYVIKDTYTNDTLTSWKALKQRIRRQHPSNIQFCKNDKSISVELTQKKRCRLGRNIAGIDEITANGSQSLIALNPMTKLRSLAIRELDVNFYGGKIATLKVFPKDKVGFYESDLPITVTNIETRYNDKLHYVGPDEELCNTYIVLKDAILYTPQAGRSYFPQNKNIVLCDTHQVEKLVFDKSPSAFFDVRAYTDAKAFTDEASGIAQTELNARFILNTSSITNSRFVLFNYVNLNMTASKFDSDFDTLKLSTFNTRDNLTSLEMVRYSKLSFKLEVDVFRYENKHDGYLKIGHTLYSTKSFSRDSSLYKRLFTPMFYTEIGGTLFASPIIKGEFKFPAGFIYAYDQPFLTVDKNWNLMIMPEVEITIDPIKKENKTEDFGGTVLFGRFRYYDMPNYRGNNFWQIQIGAKIPLSNAVSKK